MMKSGSPSAIAHLPVLYNETILALRPQSPGNYVDATIGAGGHASGILQHSTPQGRLLGLDKDPQALTIAKETLKKFGDRAVLIHASYTQIIEKVQKMGWEKVDGILLDLGVSSMQLDSPERGFSFKYDAPLDMRFDTSLPGTAADLVNNTLENDLADIIWKYGEERNSRRIARAIVHARPLKTTNELAEVIEKACGTRNSRINPATKTFQALRIAVNQELAALEEVLPKAVSILKPSARMAIITFHSLEDRIVKQFFRLESRDCICPPNQPICTCDHHATLHEITRHPITAGFQEISQNPRSRSAHLRVAERILLA
jgi:16S rRNA (cytosine1402-N4)-methyltransferase